MRRGEIAFRGFQEAWNGLWSSVDRYTCMEIPADWKNIVCKDEGWIDGWMDGWLFIPFSIVFSL
jgi:hypothetical protein